MSKETVATQKDVKITVGLDNKKVPVHMEWTADAASAKAPTECKAMLLSLFDKDHRDTIKLDLWTNEMQVVEMDRFFYQTLRALADTYFNATKNHKLANEMRHFVEYFGQQTEILPKS